MTYIFSLLHSLMHAYLYYVKASSTVVLTRQAVDYSCSLIIIYSLVIQRDVLYLISDNLISSQGVIVSCYVC